MQKSNAPAIQDLSDGNQVSGRLFHARFGDSEILD
jgi:hypothetical protein